MDFPRWVSLRALFDVYDGDGDGRVTPAELVEAIGSMHVAVRRGVPFATLDNAIERAVAVGMARACFHAYRRVGAATAAAPVDDPADPPPRAADAGETVSVPHVRAALLRLGLLTEETIALDDQIGTVPTLLRRVSGATPASDALEVTLDAWLAGIHRAPALLEWWVENPLVNSDACAAGASRHFRPAGALDTDSNYDLE